MKIKLPFHPIRGLAVMLIAFIIMLMDAISKNASSLAELSSLGKVSVGLFIGILFIFILFFMVIPFFKWITGKKK